MDQTEVEKVIKIAEREWFEKIKAAGSFDSKHLSSTWSMAGIGDETIPDITEDVDRDHLLDSD